MKEAQPASRAALVRSADSPSARHSSKPTASTCGRKQEHVRRKVHIRYNGRINISIDSVFGVLERILANAYAAQLVRSADSLSAKHFARPPAQTVKNVFRRHQECRTSTASGTIKSG